MGVALGHSLLIAPCLERGTLVEGFEPPVAAPARYFLAIAPGSGEKPRGAGVHGLAACGDANQRCTREGGGLTYAHRWRESACYHRIRTRNSIPCPAA